MRNKPFGSPGGSGGSLRRYKGMMKKRDATPKTSPRSAGPKMNMASALADRKKQMARPPPKVADSQLPAQDITTSLDPMALLMGGGTPFGKFPFGKGRFGRK